MNTASLAEVPRPVGWTAEDEVRWARVCARILRIEGGHSNDRADRGGETQYGISLRFLKAIGGIDVNRDGFGDLDLNLDTVLDGHDVRLLTPRIAEQIYCKHFWIGPAFWNLPAPFDAALFDQGVNGGVTASIKLLQKALNRFSGTKLAVDGQLGPLTRGKLDQDLRLGRQVLAAYRREAEARYRAIVLNDPSQAKYLKGWVRRAEELGRV